MPCRDWDRWAVRCGEMRSPLCVINLLSWRNSVHCCLCTRRSAAHYFISQPPLIILPVLHSSFRHVLRHISVLTFLPLSQSVCHCLSLSIRRRLEAIKLWPALLSPESLWEKLEVHLLSNLPLTFAFCMHDPFFCLWLWICVHSDEQQ